MRIDVRVWPFLWFYWALALALADAIRVAVRTWPFFAGMWTAFSRGPGLRICLGLSIGVPVVTGWPLLFWLVQEQDGYHSWLRAIAIPWWIVLAGIGFVVLAARAAHAHAEPRS